MADDGADFLTGSPFHDGERHIQKELGVLEEMDAFARKVVRDHLPEQHRRFYAELPFVILGAVDDSGAPWASILTGPPGFLRSDDPNNLSIAANVPAVDPASAGVANCRAVGLLGIELATRRRNRMNGKVEAIGDKIFTIRVDQSFGNCPQYIAAHDVMPCARQPAPPEELVSLDGAAIDLIEGADAFYVASYTDNDRAEGKRGVDVSHRGARAGFVRVEDGWLTIPDFTGNFHFNTLGNLLVNPRAGLLFYDFASGDMLQMTGETEIVWGGPEVDAFQGAERFWRFRPTRIVRRRAALALAATTGAASPNSRLTGSWSEAAARLEAAAERERWRPFNVVKITDESAVIRSFELESADGKGLLDWQAGQYLPIRIDDGDGSVIRTYTISSAPLDRRLRISVKLEDEGRVSRFLHSRISVGDVLEARAPTGEFVIDTEASRPAVLLSAGVGVTPMIAMLRQIALDGFRIRRTRPVWFFHAARSTAERAFFEEALQTAQCAGGALTVVSVIEQPGETDAIGETHHAEGRLSVEMLKQVLPFDDYEFFLCGPPGFMRSLYKGLRDLNVADARIHFEAFGPATVERRPDVAMHAEPLAAIADTAVVQFEESGFEQRWTRADGSLLEFAEAHGLSPEYGCRNGVCGSCAARVLEGGISYASKPAASVNDGCALLCVARPAKESERLRLKL